MSSLPDTSTLPRQLLISLNIRSKLKQRGFRSSPVQVGPAHAPDLFGQHQLRGRRLNPSGTAADTHAAQTVWARPAFPRGGQRASDRRSAAAAPASARRSARPQMLHSDDPGLPSGARGTGQRPRFAPLPRFTADRVGSCSRSSGRAVRTSVFISLTQGCRGLDRPVRTRCSARIDSMIPVPALGTA